MAKVFLISFIIIFSFGITWSATMYTVGDNSGWDISTDLDSWSKDKIFQVGDVLSFQYSSYHSVCELTKPNYEGCNTTNILQTSSNGNTTFALSNPGDRYFVCCNRLHCLGGMKLHVNVQGDQAASPANPPEADTGGSLPPGSTKSNSPLPSSAFLNYAGLDYVFMACLGLSSVLFGVM